MSEEDKIQVVKPTRAVVYVPTPNGLGQLPFIQSQITNLTYIPGQSLVVEKKNEGKKELSVTIFPLNLYAIEFTVPLPEQKTVLHG